MTEREIMLGNATLNLRLPLQGTAAPFLVDADRVRPLPDVAEKTYNAPGEWRLSQAGWGARLDTVLTEQGNDGFSLRQTACSPGGISALVFSLEVPDDADLYLPAWGGIRLSRNCPDIHMGFTRLPYPEMWQAQMLLIQSSNRGLLLHADDDGCFFKALSVTHADGVFCLTLETIPQAPFSRHKKLQGPAWLFKPYEGGWEQGTRLYGQFMDARLRPGSHDAPRPAWTGQIALALLTDIEDERMLTELARFISPDRVLLHYPGWRKQEYDTAYPDYTPAPEAEVRIRLASEMGFRVCVHMNMIGADTQSPDYPAECHTFDTAGREPVMERYTAFGREYAFAQINPAARRWRTIMAKKSAETAAALRVSALHYDQSLLCFNDGRGLVDGMTSMQGNAAFQADMSAALPDMAFSGEGLHEFNARNASFLQMHVYGVDNGKRTWEESRFRQIVPMTAMLYGRRMRLYHYPAMPATTDREYYLAWREAGNRMGLLPTLMRTSPEELRRPNEAMAAVLKDAAERG